MARGGRQTRKPEACPGVKGEPVVAPPFVRGHECAVLHVEPLQQATRFDLVMHIGAYLLRQHIAVSVELLGLEPGACRKRTPDKIPGTRPGYETLFLRREKPLGGNAVRAVPVSGLKQQGFVYFAAGVDIAFPQAVGNVYLRRIRIAGRTGKFLDPKPVLHIPPDVIQFNGQLRRPPFWQKPEAAVVRDGQEGVALHFQEIGGRQKIACPLGLSGAQTHHDPAEERHLFEHLA